MTLCVTRWLNSLPGASPYVCSFTREIGKSFYIVTFSYDRSTDHSLLDFCVACPSLCGKQTLWVSEVPLPHNQGVFTRKLCVCHSNFSCQSNFSFIFLVVQPEHFSSAPRILLVPSNKSQALFSLSNKQVNVYLL